jgi:hypothetical protein
VLQHSTPNPAPSILTSSVTHICNGFASTTSHPTPGLTKQYKRKETVTKKTDHYIIYPEQLVPNRQKDRAISAVLTTTSFSHTVESLPSPEISLYLPYHYAATRSFTSRNISGLSRHSFTGDHCTKVHRSTPVLQVELAIHCYHTSPLLCIINVIPANYFCTEKKGSCLLG